MKARQRGKELSSELTNIGAHLYDLLGKEDENKVNRTFLENSFHFLKFFFHLQEKRNIQANRQMEQSNADKILNGVVTSVNQKFSANRTEMETSTSERNAIFAKVERKKADLERLRQRFETLQKIRYTNFAVIFLLILVFILN